MKKLKMMPMVDLSVVFSEEVESGKEYNHYILPAAFIVTGDKLKDVAQKVLELEFKTAVEIDWSELERQTPQLNIKSALNLMSATAREVILKTPALKQTVHTYYTFTPKYPSAGSLNEKIGFVKYSTANLLLKLFPEGRAQMYSLYRTLENELESRLGIVPSNLFMENLVAPVRLSFVKKAQIYLHTVGGKLYNFLSKTTDDYLSGQGIHRMTSVAQYLSIKTPKKDLTDAAYYMNSFILNNSKSLIGKLSDPFLLRLAPVIHSEEVYALAFYGFFQGDFAAEFTGSYKAAAGPLRMLAKEGELGLDFSGLNSVKINRIELMKHEIGIRVDSEVQRGYYNGNPDDL